MDLSDILKELNTDRITNRQAVILLAKNLTTTELAITIVELRAQRNKWRELYNARKETPQ